MCYVEKSHKSEAAASSPAGPLLRSHSAATAERKRQEEKRRLHPQHLGLGEETHGLNRKGHGERRVTGAGYGRSPGGRGEEVDQDRGVEPGKEEKSTSFMVQGKVGQSISFAGCGNAGV